MNIDSILKLYFGDSKSLPTMEMFDERTIYSVYKRLFDMLVKHADLELSVLQSLGFCLYEVLDNVIIHSGKNNGLLILDYDERAAKIRLLISDDGIGICQSLRENKRYAKITEEEAVRSCINDKVSNGKGMGFGLFTMSRLVEAAGIKMEIHSGEYALCYDSGGYRTEKRRHLQGTLVFMELHTDKEIDPNDVVDNRTDAVSEFNDTFINGIEEELW